MPYVFNPFTGTFDWTAAGVPTLVTGGVTFGGSTGQIAQDTQNFNWSNGGKILALSSSTQERITNGNFTGSATGWTLPTGWSYSNNSVSHDTNGAGALSQTPTMQLGERYDVSFTLSNVTSGTVVVNFAGNTIGSYGIAGTYTTRVLCLNASAGLTFAPSIVAARFTIDSVSVKALSGGRYQGGSAYLQGANDDGKLTISAIQKSNVTPGTTQHMSLDNTGSYTWIDFKFTGVNKGHIGASASGEVSTWVSGGNGQAVYNQLTGTLISYNVAGTFGHYGYGGFQQGVNAGNTGTPSSTLVSGGGTALKVKYVTANQTLDNTATEWIADPSTATCTGTPSNACSSYTNESDCLNRDAHGGCTWYAGNPCSVYNGDESSCTGASGCTWEQASCSSFGDQSTCESYSGCSWSNNPQDCSTLGETACGSTSGCTQNYDDCANYSDGGGDGTACNNANGGSYCTYDSGTGACTGGSWYVSCSGTYDSYSCTGTYATGNCTGTYGAMCSGSATCGGIDDSTNCNAEPGCTWQSALTLTLPDMMTCPDRDYWIYNGSSSNYDVVIVPYSGQQIDHTSSYTLSNFKDWVHISPLTRTVSCSGLSEGTCGSTSGCSTTYSNCTWNSFDNICQGSPSCSGYGDQSSCEAATYYAGCTGSYVASQNWYVFGK
jgi:hypothetical protein